MKVPQIQLDANHFQDCRQE